MQLSSLGWCGFFEEAFQQHYKNGFVPARVSAESRGEYEVLAEAGTFSAKCSGRLAHRASTRRDYPAVGDWVAIACDDGSIATIHALLPRRTMLSRVEAGGRAEQVMAANVDTLFIITGLDHNYNLRRIERYLVLGRQGGAESVVILNKADLCAATAERRRAVEAIACEAPVITLSALTGEGIADIQRFLTEGKTVALLGSSGVGKSTLVNRICGDTVQTTAGVREDDSRGRHTTTGRQLIQIPAGGLLIDTPGMRELGMWEGGDGLDTSFDDVAALAARCRFRDCQHTSEPGCAIREALESDALDSMRFAAWKKLQLEQTAANRRRDVAARQLETQQWKRRLGKQQHTRRSDDDAGPGKPGK